MSSSSQAVLIFIGVFALYIIVRLLSSAVFRSYFEMKDKFNRKRGKSYESERQVEEEESADQEKASGAEGEKKEPGE